MTNKEWLATLSPDRWYVAVHWLFHDYGKRYTDTYTAVVEWLDENFDPECIPAALKERE